MRTIKFVLATTDTITLVYGVRVGANHEPARLRGISHLVEHMMFRSKNMEPKKLEPGVQYNAFTSFDTTIYYMNGGIEQWMAIADSFYAIAIQPISVDEAVFEVERNVVLNELILRGNSDGGFLDLAGYDLPVGGTVDGVRSISLPDVRRWYDEHYWDSELVVSLPKGAMATAKKYILEKFGRHLVPKNCPVAAPKKYDLARVTDQPRHVSFALNKRMGDKTLMLYMQIWSLPYSADAVIAIDFMVHVFGDCFFNGLRASKGFTYGVGISNFSTSDVGLLEISFVSGSDPIKVASYFFDEFGKLLVALSGEKRIPKFDAWKSGFIASKRISLMQTPESFPVEVLNARLYDAAVDVGDSIEAYCQRIEKVLTHNYFKSVAAEICNLNSSSIGITVAAGEGAEKLTADIKAKVYGFFKLIDG